MASQRDQQHLKKVGLEGFALIDEYFGRARRSNPSQRQLQHSSPKPQINQSHHQSFHYKVQHQQSYVCQAPQVHTVTKEPVTSYPGTSPHQYYVIAEKPQVSSANESIVSSNEAAQFNGGTMVIDYSKNKPLRWPYYN